MGDAATVTEPGTDTGADEGVQLSEADLAKSLGPWAAQRQALEKASDASNVSPEDAAALINKGDDLARQELEGHGVRDEKGEGQDPAKPEAAAKPATEQEKLQAELSKATKGIEAMQARIDQLTAKLHERDGKPAEGAPKEAGKTLKDLSDEQLQTLWEQADQRLLDSKKDEDTGETQPGDPAKNARVKYQIEKEIRRREREAEEKPVREAKTLKDAHDASAIQAFKDYRKYLTKTTEQDGKQVVVYDPDSPVSKKAHQIMQTWEKNDSVLARHPDMPRLAVQSALAELSAGADAKMARELHRLQIENSDLKNRGNMDGGSSGGKGPGKAPASADAFSDDNYMKSRQAQFNRRGGG